MIAANSMITATSMMHMRSSWYTKNDGYQMLTKHIVDMSGKQNNMTTVFRRSLTM